MSTILIVEDETELVRVLRSYLEKAGFAVVSVNRGDTALFAFDQHNPDLILLDLNLPGLDGLDVAREIRRRGETPVIMMTARVEETDRLIGLELGADDYVTKPFSPREVVARVRAVLRRSGAVKNPGHRLVIGDVEIDQEAHTAKRSGVILDLTPTEFNLLFTLASQPGRAFSRLQLLEFALGTVYEGFERTVDAHIKNLRAKLEPDPGSRATLKPFSGLGIVFGKSDKS